MFECVRLDVDGLASQTDGAFVVRLEEDAEGVEGQLQLRAEAHEDAADWLDVTLPLEHRLHDAPFAAAEAQLLGEPVVVNVTLPLLHQEKQPVVESCQKELGWGLKSCSQMRR